MTAKQLTDSILQLAIQGKLVPQDPKDEPARVLLQRIREKKKRLVKEGKLKKKDLEEKPFSEDEIPFAIPESWAWVRFSNVACFFNGDRSKNYPNKNEYVTQGVAWINTGHIEPNGYLTTSRMNYITEEKYNSLSSGKIEKGDLVYCLRGATYGKVAKVDPYEKGAVASSLMIIRLLNIDIRDYIFTYLKSSFSKDQLLKFANGAAQPNLAAKDVSNYLLPLPPLAEQHRIVKRIEEILPIVKEYGEAYEEASKMDAELPDKLKKSILQEAIKGKLGTQNSNDEPASILLKQIREEKKRLVKEGKLKKKEHVEIPVDEEEEPFKIPESWKWCRLAGVSYMYTGNSISESEKSAKYTNVVGMSYIGTKDVGFDHSIHYNNGIRIPLKFQDNFKKAPSGSILMCIEGGSAGRKIGILSEEVCFGNKLCCFNPICVNNKYIYYYLQSPTLRDIFKSNMNGIIGGVSISKLSPLIIPIPPLSEQNRIVEKIEALFAEIDNMTINKDLNKTETKETQKE